MFVKTFKLTPENLAKCEMIVTKDFAEVEKRLSDGRKYLLGDKFSAADLCFAAASATILLVREEEGYGAPVPTLDKVPPVCRDLALRFRDTVAGRFVLRLFREERGERQIAFGQKARKEITASV